jgi:nickel/cobalt transporter (NicO) family protein
MGFMGFENVATLGGLSAMFSLGVLHALEPAHGKVLMGGYFANQSARPRDAIFLSLLLTLFQSLTMMAIALLLGYFSYGLFQSALAPVFERWVDVLGGVMMAFMGFLMLWHQRQHHRNADVCCQHESASETHSPGAGTTSRHSFLSLLLLSFLWGLVPCPIALSAILSAWSSGSYSALVAGVAMFSLGVGSILLTSSLCFIYASHFIQHRLTRLEPILNRGYNVLAVGFIALGLFYTVLNVFWPH